MEKSKLEWFWDFNIRLLKLLESKGFDIELAEKSQLKKPIRMAPA